MKKVLLVVGIIAILAAIPLTVLLVKRSQDIRKKAAPATILSLSPTELTSAQGESFSLDITIDTGDNQVTGADIMLVFDPEKLEAESIQKGNFLPNILVAGEVAPGSASIALGAPSTTPGTGMGILATVSFKTLAISETPISIRFSQPETQVVGIGEQGNVLVNTTPSLITISNTQGIGGSDAYAATPTPSPSPTYTPDASPTSTPSATTTTITVPSEGATTAAKPTISGTSFANANVTLTITATTPITAILTTNTTGSWSYTPTTNLEAGSHTITISVQNPNTGSIETATRSFIVQGSGGTQTSTSSGVPVAGSITNTITTFGAGIVFFIIGALALIL